MRLAIVLFALVVILSGCGGRRGQSIEPNEGRQTLEHGGRTRSFLVRLPAPVPQGHLMPLVLVLHGGGGNGANAESMTGFTHVARSEGFIVAYPEGTARGRLRLLTWNAGHCCGYAMESRIDDVGFLDKLIDHLSQRYPVDPDRIFVTGMSNGAMMSHRVGIELGEKVAAIAPVVGGVFGDEQTGRSPVSALMINGMLDRSVPYEGGAPGGLFAESWDGAPLRPATDQAQFWAAVGGCSSATREETPVYIHVRYQCPDAVGVELYSVKDNGHAWPGGERGSRLGDVPTRELNATRLIWAFFSAHPKR